MSSQQAMEDQVLKTRLGVQSGGVVSMIRSTAHAQNQTRSNAGLCWITWVFKAPWLPREEPGVWLILPGYVGRSKCERIKQVLTGTLNLTASFKVLDLSVWIPDTYAVTVIHCENRNNWEKPELYASGRNASLILKVVSLRLPPW